MPHRASVVIVGGGVIGASIAFHLAEAGVRDVVLLERGALGSGSTCKAAGGVRAQFSDELNVLIGARSLDAYARFGERTGQEIGLRRVGHLFLLSEPDHVAAFTRGVALQNALGVESRLVDSAEARRLSPLITTEGLLAAVHSPHDGHCTPQSVVLGYAGAARRLGARLYTGVTVRDLELRGDEVRTVVTDRGRVTTDTVVCAAGAWAGAVGAMAGVDLPVTPLRRQMLCTGPVRSLRELSEPLPFTVDFGTSFSFHQEGPGLLIGMSDPMQEPGFDTSYSPHWLPRLGAALARRAPALLDVGLGGGWAGLYEMSPDGNAVLGRSVTPANFVYATGFSGHGFLQAPAVGEIVRDLCLGRAPFVDVGPLHAGRFAPGAAAPRPESHVV
ncbi:NAD(P)/FAD-dependent oxidoreductase [Streptomyces sp. NPDC059578]|uniref:NAD(P)/FAD-dependent oxidoreductase n=1 Tax=Streptomyces sp. NPDC059578 TaxID=3346874 RepID=UPI003699243A